MSQLRCPCIEWVEAREAAQHPSVQMDPHREELRP